MCSDGPCGVVMCLFCILYYIYIVVKARKICTGAGGVDAIVVDGEFVADEIGPGVW